MERGAPAGKSTQQLECKDPGVKVFEREQTKKILGDDRVRGVTLWHPKAGIE
jgi:hypothetical protein